MGYKDLKIYQDSRFFSFSLDSIVLANYSNIRLRDKIIVDFCTGNGVIPIILSRRCNKRIVGVEIQKDLAQLAIESLKHNNIDNSVEIICDDIKNYSKMHLNEVDLLLCNPPYFKADDNGSYSLSYEKRVARHELLITLEDVCVCANRVLKDNGNFYVVYRSDRLIELLNVFKKHNLEPKTIKFVHENINSESFMVLVCGQKGGHVGLKVLKPLILYDNNGAQTDEYKKLQEEVINNEKS